MGSNKQTNGITDHAPTANVGGNAGTPENTKMLMSQTKEVKHHADEIQDSLNPNQNVHPWVVAKAERASTDMSDIAHYLDGISKYGSGGSVHDRERLMKIVNRYNPTFSEKELENILNDSNLFDFWDVAVGKTPATVIEKEDREVSNQLFDKIKFKRAEIGGQFFSNLNSLMQGRSQDVAKARKVWESFDKKQKDDFIDYWISTHSTFGVDEATGEEVTPSVAMKDINYLLYEQDNLNDTKVEHETKKEAGGLSEVTDMLPTPEPMSVIDPMAVGGDTAISRTEKAKNRFKEVINEFKSGTLMDDSGEPIMDKNVAMNMAWSEARKIQPHYGRFSQGSDVSNTKNATVNNEQILRILADNGTNKMKYSQSELKQLRTYQYRGKLTGEVCELAWGLAKKHGYEPYQAKVFIMNVGTGRLLSYVPETTHVHAYELERQQKMIASVLYTEDNFKIIGNLDRIVDDYDLCIANYAHRDLSHTGELSLISSKIKIGGLMIMVADNGIFDGGQYGECVSLLNSNFNLIEAYKLPKGTVDNCSILVLKKL